MRLLLRDLFQLATEWQQLSINQRSSQLSAVNNSWTGRRAPRNPPLQESISECSTQFKIAHQCKVMRSLREFIWRLYDLIICAMPTNVCFLSGQSTRSSKTFCCLLLHLLSNPCPCRPLLCSASPLSVTKPTIQATQHSNLLRNPGC